MLPQDASGQVLEDREIHWSSSDASVVDVSATGVAYAAAAGSAIITATCEGYEATISIVADILRESLPAQKASIML